MFKFRCLLKSIFLLFFISIPVYAQTFDEGMKAYEEGHCTKALHIFSIFADQGHENAIYMMVEILSGEICDFKVNVAVLLEWLSLAYMSGHPSARERLIEFFLNREGRYTDYEALTSELREEAKECSPEAIFLLGYSFAFINDNNPQLDYELSLSCLDTK